MLTDSIKKTARRLAERIAGILARTGLTPNMVTLIGFALNVAVGVVLAVGHVTAGGILLLVFGAMDTLDGALARVTGRITTFGAFLDSTLDRYSEAVVLLGLLIWYANAVEPLPMVLIYAVIVGSLMVSYTRARAEGLGLQCEVGLLARPERIVLLGLGLIFHQVIIVLWILAVLTNFTAFQRVLHVWNVTREQG